MCDVRYEDTGDQIGLPQGTVVRVTEKELKREPSNCSDASLWRGNSRKVQQSICREVTL